MVTKHHRTTILFLLLCSVALLACGPEEVWDDQAYGRRAPATLPRGKADVPSWLRDTGRSLSCTAKLSGAFSGSDSAHLLRLASGRSGRHDVTFAAAYGSDRGAALAVFEATSGKLVKSAREPSRSSVTLSFTGKAGASYLVGIFSVTWQATGAYTLRLACPAGAATPPTKAGSQAKATSGYKVAAVQYGSGQAARVSATCASHAAPNICALKTLTSKAANAGARLVVLPEYALGRDQQYYERPPKIGSNPATESGWAATSIVKQFSVLARKHKLFLVFDMATSEGGGKYNTAIALGPVGRVVAVHHKFNLFGSETKKLTPGKNVSVFDTPAGKVGLLICADIYGSSTLLSRLAYKLKARIVAISSYWTVNGAVGWYKRYTKKYGVYAVVGNTTHSPGYGGGVYDPKGKAMAEKVQGQPSIVFAVIPPG